MRCSLVFTDERTDDRFEIRMAILRFGMPVLRIKVNGLILPILTPKLVTIALATSLEPSEKRGGVRSVMCDQIPTIWWKFGEDRSSRS